MVRYLRSTDLRPQEQKQNKKIEDQTRSLLYSGGRVSFKTEKDLELFFLESLPQFLPDIEILDNQVSIDNQRIDIIAINKQKQAVIIELKNEEDRGIVPQLTRYRSTLIKNPVFTDRIDYSQPIQMIGVAPSFHADNYTDKEASKFEQNIYLHNYYIQHSGQAAYFFFQQKFILIPLPILGLVNPSDTQERNSSPGNLFKGLPLFTIEFLNNLRSDKYPDVRQEFSDLRKIFLQQPKCNEFIMSNYSSCLYAAGTGEKSKKLAEITNTRKGIFLYLWIPFSFKIPQKLQIARCCFVMKDGFSPLSKMSEIDYINYCPKGTVKISEKPQENSLNFSRRWCSADRYVWHLRSESGKGINLLFELFSMEHRDQHFWKEGEGMKLSISTQLAWYLDVAIRLWNYQILGKNFLEIDPRFQN